MEIDDSEVVQTARKAKELLDRLEEYKSLAKVCYLIDTSLLDESWKNTSLLQRWRN